MSGVSGWQRRGVVTELGQWPLVVLIACGLLLGSLMPWSLPWYGGLIAMLPLALALMDRRPLVQRGCLFLSACTLAWWWQGAAPEPPSHYLQDEATVERVLFRRHAQGMLLSLPRLDTGVFATAGALPVMRVGDRLHVRGLVRWERYRGRLRPRLYLAEVAIAVRREQGPRGWAWQALSRLQRHQDLAGSLLLGRGRPDAIEDFRQAGLAHVLAVSGLHVGIALAVLGLLLYRCPWWLFVGGLGSAAMGYLWLTGAPLPTQRAVIMALALLLGGISWRRAHALGGWALAVIVLLLMDPGQARFLGFQLSVAAVFGILTIGRTLLAWRRRLPVHAWPLDRLSWRCLLWCCRWTLDGLAVGISASLATAPVLLLQLGVATPWSPVSTLLAGPLLLLVLATGLPLILLAGLWPEGPWELLYRLLEVGLDALLALAHWAATWPVSQVTAQQTPWLALTTTMLLIIALFCLPRPVWRRGDSQ
ncbi:MAG: ComEC/Rec2 family competence protein [Planctomycetota bacterium]